MSIAAVVLLTSFTYLTPAQQAELDAANAIISAQLEKRVQCNEIERDQTKALHSCYRDLAISHSEYVKAKKIKKALDR